MSALSLIGQAQIIPYTVIGGIGNNGIQFPVFNEVIPLGYYIGQTIITLNGLGVTSGDFVVSYGQPIAESFLDGQGGTSSACFFFESDGSTALTINVVGFGANWTSTPSTLFLRRLV